MTITKEEMRALKLDNHVVLDKSGVDAWGLYIGLVSPWHETRLFIAGKVVCKYSRAFGNARTTWKGTTWPNTEAALSYASKASSADSIIVGSPILVQLTDSDVALVKAGNMPAARYRGQAKHEQLYGKVLDKLSHENASNSHAAADFNKVAAARIVATSSAMPGLTHAVASATTTTTTTTTTGVPGPVDDEPF